MKRFLLTTILGVATLFGFAQTEKTYTDDLVVTIDGNSAEPQQAEIQVEFLDNNKCNLSLKNFCLGAGADMMYVGNIELNDIELVAGEGYQTFDVDQTITITPGDLQDVPEDVWIGPMLGEVPIKMTGKVNDEQLYCEIDINMVSLGQVIKVTFGSDIAASVSGVSVATGKVDVYSVSGILVRKQVDVTSALNGLQRGIYIVGGRKMIKK